MTTKLGIVMNGITGRVGRKHLEAIRAIQNQGGLISSSGERIMPEPILVGRDTHKLEIIGRDFGFSKQSTDLKSALEDSKTSIYFDALVPLERPNAIRQALTAGKHVYAEKPLAMNFETAYELARIAQAAKLKHGLVQNMLFQPGPRKLEQLVRSGFFGRILSAKIDFGYWVFEGDWQAAQRPSWNYRREDGGSVVTDMFPHWNGLLEMLFGRVSAVSSLSKTHIPQRFDEQQKPYTANADDASYSLLELEGGVIVQISASWATRVYQDDFFQIQIDGTHGSARAGYKSCKVQHRVNTPRSVAAFGLAPPRDAWQELPDLLDTSDPFKTQWEYFLRAVVNDEAFPWNFFAAARGLQLADTALQSNLERRWLNVSRDEMLFHDGPFAVGEAHA
jgi:predicted dehydrogenase